MYIVLHRFISTDYKRLEIGQWRVSGLRSRWTRSPVFALASRCSLWPMIMQAMVLWCWLAQCRRGRARIKRSGGRYGWLRDSSSSTGGASTKGEHWSQYKKSTSSCARRNCVPKSRERWRISPCAYMTRLRSAASLRCSHARMQWAYWRRSSSSWHLARAAWLKRWGVSTLLCKTLTLFWTGFVLGITAQIRSGSRKVQPWQSRCKILERVSDCWKWRSKIRKAPLPCWVTQGLEVCIAMSLALSIALCDFANRPTWDPAAVKSGSRSSSGALLWVPSARPT